MEKIVGEGPALELKKELEMMYPDLTMGKEQKSATV